MDSGLAKSIKTATKIIARKDCSKIEITDNLVKKGFEPCVIEKTLEYLIYNNWYDETKSAIELAGSKIRKGCFGPQYISKLLFEKKYPDEIISKTISCVFNGNVEYELAEKTATEKFRRLKRKFVDLGENRDKIKSILINYLACRGFTENVCESIADKILFLQTG